MNKAILGTTVLSTIATFGVYKYFDKNHDYVDVLGPKTRTVLFASVAYLPTFLLLKKTPTFILIRSKNNIMKASNMIDKVTSRSFFDITKNRKPECHLFMEDLKNYYSTYYTPFICCFDELVNCREKMLSSRKNLREASELINNIENDDYIHKFGIDFDEIDNYNQIIEDYLNYTQKALIAIKNRPEFKEDLRLKMKEKKQRDLKSHNDEIESGMRWLKILGVLFLLKPRGSQNE